MEEIDTLEEIRHPLIREALRLVGCDPSGLEIASMADIPAGTGLGSSGSFTTALLKALHAHNKNLVHPHELAQQACHLELDVLKEPIGKQDQYIASFGGITCFRFQPSGEVEAWPLKAPQHVLEDLEDHLLLFFTGYTRAAGDILKEQDSKSKASDPDMIANLHFVKEIGLETKRALEAGDSRRLGALMNEHWKHKKRRSPQMSNDRINDWYELAMRNGALGGKLIGAGGGGFLMFYTEDRSRLRKALTEAGMKEVRFRFDFEGTKVIIQ
jgi:D-glycero-alpha-D-manno-heptose-7-phosphate kinase